LVNRMKERGERKENTYKQCAHLHTLDGKRTRMKVMTKRKPPARLLLSGDSEGVGVVAPVWHLGTWYGQTIYHSTESSGKSTHQRPSCRRSQIACLGFFDYYHNWRRDAKNAEDANRSRVGSERLQLGRNSCLQGTSWHGMNLGRSSSKSDELVGY
jgi:DNA-binding PucR family transcriptional regulator